MDRYNLNQVYLIPKPKFIVKCNSTVTRLFLVNEVCPKTLVKIYNSFIGQENFF